MNEPTKERIKKVAFAFFATKGFYGTTMNEIAEGVGIKKPSLYSHFSGKEELFFAVYEDLAAEYKGLMERLLAESEQMKPEEQLAYIFEQYIVYFADNPKIQSFWNQITFFCPAELKDRFGNHIWGYEEKFQQQMESIFSSGMRDGTVATDDPARLMWSYRVFREGLLNWMIILPELKPECIPGFWQHLWNGLKNNQREKA